MNQERSIRTISVRYTLVFCVIIGFLFLFSQILDTLFYDYTVVETEIVFIKRVDETDNSMIIELNEVTETSNSLVLTIQNKMQDTIEEIYRIINHINEQEDYTAQNSQYRQQYNLLTQSYFIDRKQQGDSIYILNVKNTLNSEKVQVDITIYSDKGTNFFDLAQTITLNNYWNEESVFNLKNKIVTKCIYNNDIILLFHDYVTKQQQIALLDDRITTIYETSDNIINMAVGSQSIVIEKQFDRNLHVISFTGEETSQIVVGSYANYYEILTMFYINEDTIAIIYLEVTNDRYHLIGVAHNQFKYIFLKVDITEDGLSKDLLYDYDSEHQILVLLFKKYLFYVKLKGQTRRIQFEMEKEIFQKIQYSHEDQKIYILSESTQQKFKMYLVDLSMPSSILRLRMPYFRQGMVAKDFQLKKNQIILFLLRNGDVACIQPLQYGEGVLKKTFIIELLDIILTLSFIGFFRYLKRLLQKIYSKIISCCRRM